MPPLQRQQSARRRSLTKPEDAIFAQSDSDRDAYLNRDEFKEAIAQLKDSEKKPAESGDEEQVAMLQQFLEAMLTDETLLMEVFDELRNSHGEKNEQGVSLGQWKSAEFFEDDE